MTGRPVSRPWAGFLGAGGVFRLVGTGVEGLPECVADAQPGGGDGFGPAPGGVDARVPLTAAAGEAGSYVQYSVAEGFDLAACQIGVVGEADGFGPGGQIGCGPTNQRRRVRWACTRQSRRAPLRARQLRPC